MSTGVNLLSNGCTGLSDRGEFLFLSTLPLKLSGMSSEQVNEEIKEIKNKGARLEYSQPELDAAFFTLLHKNRSDDRSATKADTAWKSQKTTRRIFST